MLTQLNTTNATQLQPDATQLNTTLQLNLFNQLKSQPSQPDQHTTWHIPNTIAHRCNPMLPNSTNKTNHQTNYQQNPTAQRNIIITDRLKKNKIIYF